MLNMELRARFDDVRLAMERVRSGESDIEQIGLPSGDSVTIHRDTDAPIGIRILTADSPPRVSSFPRDDPRWGTLLRRYPVGTDPESFPQADAAPAGSAAPDSPKTPGDAVPGARSSYDFVPEEGTPVAQIFGPSEVRPQDYPDDLPFLPGCAVSVSFARSKDGSRRARNAVWARPPEPTRTLEKFKAYMRNEGWEQLKTSQASNYMGETLSCSFRKGGVQRVLSFMAFGEFHQIMLFENTDA